MTDHHSHGPCANSIAVRFGVARMVVLLLALVSWIASVRAAEASATIATSEEAKAWRESFDIVWQTIKDKHFDTNFTGGKWERVREQYLPRLATLKTDHELYDLLREMLGELHQSHFNIVPPDSIPSNNSKAAVDGVIGIKTRLVEGRLLVTSVTPRSPAAKAGLRPGFVITAIDDKLVAELIRPVLEGNLAPGLRRLFSERAVGHKIDGDAGTSVTLTWLDGQDRTKRAAVKRVEQKGEMSLPLGNFPPQHTEFEARRLLGNIGYIRFNIFMISQMDKIRAALRTFHKASGIIFDLRGNPGGVGGMAMGMGGLLFDQQTSLGTMQMRAGHINFVVFPQPGAYLGPVVVLTDAGSASTSEIFAAGLQELGRARVVGERTAGAALPSFFEKLPAGALFQYAVGDFKTPSGHLIEGDGVLPDVPVNLTRSTLLRGHDAQLDAAVKEVQKLRHAPAHKAN